MTVPIPSLTGGAGGAAQSGSQSYAGVSVPINTPFNFDNSGWNVNIKGQGNQSAQGNSDANAGGAASAITSKTWMYAAAAAVAIWYVARRS